MANDVAKFGTSPDGISFQEKDLAASSVRDTDGITAQEHMADTAKHITAAERTTWNSKANTSAIPTKTSQLSNDSGFLTPSSSLNAEKLTGVVPIGSIPPSAMERMEKVANDTARFALTTAKVQNGDTVKVTETGKMYLVIDDTKLSTEAGYEPYTAGGASSVPWGGITSKPTTISGYGITDAPTANLTTVTQTEAEAGTATTARAWNALRIRQAINANKDAVFVNSESEIASSGVRPGGLVFIKV